MPLLEMHARLAFTALFYSLILTIWGFIRVVGGKKFSASYWSAILVGEALLVVQAVLGAAGSFGGQKALSSPGHYLLGVLTVLTLPAIYFLSRRKLIRRPMVAYSLGFFFLLITTWFGINSIG